MIRRLASNSLVTQQQIKGLQTIKLGGTTTNQALNALGNPEQRNISIDGEETWIYNLTKVSATPSAAIFVPYIGGLLNQNSTTTNSETLKL